MWDALGMGGSTSNRVSLSGMPGLGSMPDPGFGGLQGGGMDPGFMQGFGGLQGGGMQGLGPLQGLAGLQGLGDMQSLGGQESLPDVDLKRK